MTADIADQGFLQSVALGEGVVWTKAVNEAVNIEGNASTATGPAAVAVEGVPGGLYVSEGVEDCGLERHGDAEAQTSKHERLLLVLSNYAKA